MVIISRNVETIEKQGNLNKFSHKTTAKDMRGWINGWIGTHSKRGNLEMVFVFQEVLKAYNYFEKESDKEVIIELEGWKGEGNIEIYNGFENNFIIIEHIKDKETGEVEDKRTEVSKVQVNNLLFWIKKWELNETHTCYEFAEFLGYASWKDLWAERKKYFAEYYYPIKVLEAMKVINYSGRGKVTKLK